MLHRFARLALLGLVGCVGSVVDADPAEEPAQTEPGPGGSARGASGNRPGDPAPPIPGPPAEGPGACRETAPLVSAARRLTRDQYSNTLRDLLGDSGANGDRLPADDASDGLFVAPSTLIVTPAWAGNAMTAAEEAARAAVTKLPTLLPCSATGGEACARTFIDTFGRRAFRRPVQPVEASGLLEVFRVGAGNGGFARGIELVLQAILQSPSFLYRMELGAKDGNTAGVIKLTGHEVAARLSYGLWGTMPDDDLMKDADEGRLGTADEIEAHARRMVADPRARATLTAFAARWFALEGLDEVMKDPAEYPEFNEKLIHSMKDGFAAFWDDLLTSGQGRFASVLTAPYAMADASTAPLYGVTAPAGKPTKVVLPGGRRFGLLTDVGVLTAHTFADPSAPIHRGKFIRERLFCTDPPNPPADLMVEPPTPRPGVSTRERLKEHTDVPACRGCHEFMDPIGFAFGNFDGLGRWRDRDNGQPIDASGALAFTDVDGPIAGVAGLAEKLSQSADVEACVAGTLLRFASGIESQIDECAQRKLARVFRESNGDLAAVIVAITRTDAFRHRRAVAGEVSP